MTEIAVELVRAWPQACERLRVELAQGSKVGDAIARAAGLGFVPALEADAGCLAIFGRAANLATPLRDGDRIELLRPLLADPKQRRRERAVARKP